jgi:hypothetical protein
MEEIKLILLKFDKDSVLVHPNQLATLLNEVNSGIYDDLIVLSHGWNNNDQEAFDLYNRILRGIEQNINSNKFTKILAVGVIWPSKKFGDPASPSVALGLAENVGLIKQCEALAGSVDDATLKSRFGKIADLIKANSNAELLTQEFNDLFKRLKLVFQEVAAKEEVFPNFIASEIKLMLNDDNYWMNDLPVAGSGIATRLQNGNDGSAMSLFSGIKDGVQNLLNLTTYYMMKNRSGFIGRKGLRDMLSKIVAANSQIKIHLVGHSFGARLVSSALLGEQPGDEIKVNSLSLLQAAFSHYAFSQNFQPNVNGHFRIVIESKLVRDAFIITHSKNDKAVGVAYAVASRLARMVGSGIGGRNDPFGGLGGNGAQITPEVEKLILLGDSGSYNFKSGKIYNLLSDAYVLGHSDICNKEISNALVYAFGWKRN